VIIVYSASVLLFYVSSRYRLPLIPVLVMFAAAGITEVSSFIHAAPWWKRSLGAISLGGVAIACNWPTVDADSMRAMTYFNFATQFEQAGDLSHAIDHYHLAIAIDPANVEAQYNLGLCYVHTGRLKEAARQFRAALEQKPDFAIAALNLGNVYLEAGDLDQAEQMFLRVIDLDPSLPQAFNGIGMVELQRGQFSEAVRHFERAVQIAPQFSNAQENLSHARRAQKSKSPDY
jgi:tetratricopeptide (TPR) repeat protein